MLLLLFLLLYIRRLKRGGRLLGLDWVILLAVLIARC